MQTVASMKEYINEYVRTNSIEKVGYTILKEHFGIPFLVKQYDELIINNIPLTREEASQYIKEFFEGIDTGAVIELYNKIKV